MILKSEMRKLLEEVLEEYDDDSIESKSDDIIDRMFLDFTDMYDDEDEEAE